MTQIKRWFVILIPAACLFGAAWSVHGQQAAAAKAFQARCDQLLSYYAARTTAPSFQGACAKLASHIDSDRAVDLIEAKLEAPSGDMFFIYPLIGTYLHFQNRLPHHILDRMKHLFSVYTPYRGDTENHWLMYYTALYLAAQTWPFMDGSFWFNGKTSSENLIEAADYLGSWIDLTTTKGQGEFDSPDYAGVYLSPLCLLYDFAADPSMRLKARMMLDYFLADWAGEHLKGMLCGGFSRVYEPRVYTPREPVVSTLLWLYFGDCTFNGTASMHEAIFPALSSYRVPDIIRAIANDRSEPYMHRETKRIRHIIRYNEIRNPPVFKTMYMTDKYALGSLHGGILQPIQQHTWGLTWVSDKKHPTLFTLHPYYSSRELATFFPEEPKVLVDDVVKSKGTYNKPDKWTGGSPYEQTFQHENTIIVLYELQQDGWPHIDGFFPKQFDEKVIDDSGWIFCREGDIFIAYYPLRPYIWIEEEACHRLRSFDKRNGLILEVSSSKEMLNFETFIKCIRQNDRAVDTGSGNVSVAYTNCAGDQLEFTFNGPRRLNGEPVDLGTYGLFNSPYLVSPLGSGRLEIRYKESRLILDFNNLKRIEKADTSY
jgi:hypothetical protein